MALDAVGRDKEVDREMIEALEGVVDALQATCEEGTVAARHVDALHAEDGGRADPVRDGSLLVRRLGAVQRRLGDAAARFRRSQVRVMRSRGMTTDGIAEEFGVTRQRVSRLLNSEPLERHEFEPPS